MRTAGRRALSLCLAAVLFFPLSFSFRAVYAYWKAVITNPAVEQLDVLISHMGSAAGQLDRLPPNTPDDVREKLEKMLLTESAYVVDALIDAVAGIVDTPMYGGDLHVAASLEDFFYEGSKPIESGAILIYATEGNDMKAEYNIIHVRGDTWRDITSVEVLLEALADPWSLVNMVSTVWIRGNLYTPAHAPIEHAGKYYLLYHFGESGTPPDVSNAWFELPEEYEYIPSNTGGNGYITGMLVSYNGQYFYCKSTGGNPEPSVEASWKWDIVPQHQETVSYPERTRVYTTDGSSVRFWISLKPTSVSPDEQTARSGDWQELKKGWIGSQDDLTIKPFYFAHNTYSAGDVVIFGVSPKMHYQYFRALKDVPGDRPPIVREEGVNIIDTEHWENVFYEGYL